jgi:hypothetical protein
MNMMSCEHITRAAGDLLEHRLPWHQRLLVRSHLAMCKGCGVFVEQFRLTLLALRSLPGPESSPASEALLHEFRQHANTPRR